MCGIQELHPCFDLSMIYAVSWQAKVNKVTFLPKLSFICLQLLSV